MSKISFKIFYQIKNLALKRCEVCFSNKKIAHMGGLTPSEVPKRLWFEQGTAKLFALHHDRLVVSMDHLEVDCPPGDDF